MWARRCGAPPAWPSRIKVILMSALTAAVGAAVYTFMTDSDAGYLDLHVPVTKTVECLDRWPRRVMLTSLFSQQVHADWFQYTSDDDAYRRQHRCNVTYYGQQCEDVAIPLKNVNHNLGMTMIGPERLTHAGMDMWALFFLLMTVLLFITVAVHDLALLHVKQKDYVLDWSTLNAGAPCVRRSFNLFGVTSYCRLFQCQGARSRLCGLICGIAITPVIFVWWIFVFLFLVSPVTFLLFFLHPIRMSRFGIFFICMALAIYGVCLSIQEVVQLSSDAHKPVFALTWTAPATLSDLSEFNELRTTSSSSIPPCTCGCSYYMNQTTCAQLLLIGIGTTIKSLLVGFRCLKGLRRAQWANLMSTTFAVPLNIYDVVWTRPDGSAIQHRDDGDPVQSELAFDPFALMDEQPESAISSTSPIHPELLAIETSKAWRARGLGSETHQVNYYAKGMDCAMHKTEYIGCCGFPCLTGGRQGAFDLEELAPLETEIQTDAEGPPSLRREASNVSCQSATSASSNFGPRLSSIHELSSRAHASRYRRPALGAISNDIPAGLSRAHSPKGSRNRAFSEGDTARIRAQDSGAIGPASPTASRPSPRELSI